VSAQLPPYDDGVEPFSFRRLLLAQAAFALVLLIGTIGFHQIIGEGWVASFYRSVVTTTLTGLDTPPPTAAGQLFSVLLLLAGVAIFLYIAGAVVELITRGVVGGALAERKRRRIIEELEDHVIICGFGRVGRAVAEEIASSGRACVVVDVNEESVARASDAGLPVIHGDGTEDAELVRAGIERAHSLVACADSDEKNVFITLSARSARPDLVIVARASSHATAEKLRRAGADRVVEPYAAAGRTMATQVLKPQVAALLEVAGAGGTPDLRFEEIVVTAGCDACERSLRELDLRGRTGASVVAVRRPDGTLVASPAADDRLGAGDVVVAMGSPTQIGRLEDVFALPEPAVD
jgi:voltage-gated potassium channel